MTKNELKTIAELLKDYPNYTYIESTNSLLYDDGTDRVELELDGLMAKAFNIGAQGLVDEVVESITESHK